jgi:AraC family transcriptional regulator
MALSAPTTYWDDTEAFPTTGDALKPRIIHAPFGRLNLVNVREPIVGHAHHHAEITVKVSGPDRTLVVQGQKLPLTDRTAVLVNPWEEHAMPAPLCGPDGLLLSLYLDRWWFASLRVIGAPFATFTHSCVDLSPASRIVVDALVHPVLRADELVGERIEGLVRTLTLDLLPRPAARAIEAFQRVGRAPIWDARIRRAVAYMEGHSQTGLSASSVAAEACISRAHFFSRFKHCTSLTPHVFANLLRMEAAIGRLLEPEPSIKELSNELGFSAPSNFTRFFRQRAGFAPSEYRRNVAQLHAGTTRAFNR